MQSQSHLGWKKSLISNPLINAIVRNPLLNHDLKYHIYPAFWTSTGTESTTVLGSLFQCLTTLSVRRFLLISNPSLPWSTWSLFLPYYCLLPGTGRSSLFPWIRLWPAKAELDASILAPAFLTARGIRSKYLNCVLRNMWCNPLTKEQIHYTYISFRSYYFFPLDKYQEAWWQRLPTGWNRDLSKCEMLLFRSKLKPLAIIAVSGV